MTPEELKKIRKKWGKTQAQMAAALGTPAKTYQHWEYGRRRIPGIVKVALDCLSKN